MSQIVLNKEILLQWKKLSWLHDQLTVVLLYKHKNFNIKLKWQITWDKKEWHVTQKLIYEFIQQF